MKIYTRTGDDGTTSLCDGSRLSKDDMRVEAYGTLDELNAHIGLLISLLHTSSLKEGVQPAANLTDFLSEIQEELFVIGGELARAEIKTEEPVSTQKLITKIETIIDELSFQLPVQHHFVLPGGVHSSISKSCLPYDLSSC